MKFFELTLLADQSLVQAGWVEAAPLPEIVKLLASGASGRAPLGGVELSWSFEPSRGITTMRIEGRVTLVSVLVSDQSPELVQSWLAELRKMPPIKTLHGDDPEAFEVIARLPHRPLCASVLFPEGERDASKPLLDQERAIAAALFSARWA